MFQFLKKLKPNFKFRSKKKQIHTSKEVSFTDLAGTAIDLQVRVNGHDTVVAIIDEKNGYEIILDHGLATLLSVMLQSYNAHETFLNLEDEK